MDYRSKIQEDFSTAIYTQFHELEVELKRRREDPVLLKKVEVFLGEDLLKEIRERPRAVLSRTIATPNAELLYFLDLASDLGIDPLILEYPDKFVAKNPDKYHLGRLFFYRKAKDLKSFPTSTLRIVNFNTQEGKQFKEIRTSWNESIVEFHHNLLFEAIPSLRNSVVDFTEWFNKARTSHNFYYLQFLALFVCHGVLFDNFLIEDKEEGGFVRERFLPSFHEIERVFGVKPLIFPLIPFDGEKLQHWLSYPEHLRTKVDEHQRKHSNI